MNRQRADVPSEHILERESPAGSWLEAFPLGNGRLGVMAFGRPSCDRYQINDGTAWSGSVFSSGEHKVPASVAAEALRQARQALAAGDFQTATTQMKRMQGGWSQAYLPFVDLKVETSTGAGPQISHYRRRLEFDTGTNLVEYHDGEAVVTWRSAVSHADGVFVIRLTSTAPLSLRVELSSQLRVVEGSVTRDDASLVVRLPSDVPPPYESDMPIVWDDDQGRAGAGAARASWITDGIPVTGGADDVRHATIIVASATTFRGIGLPHATDINEVVAEASGLVERARALGVEALVRRQRSDHQRLYGRMALTLPHARHVSRLTHYGRYLLISSSRAGGLPATLQGLWNDSLRAPWSSAYTTNINLEMNYWASDSTQLAECLEPYWQLVEALSVTGAETAHRLYGTRGWVAHHNTDAWAYSDAVGRGTANPSWAAWPFAGAWLVQQLIDHVRFGGGIPTARRALPLVHGAAVFLLDWLRERPDGTLGTSPSTSPENEFLAPDGEARAVGESSTMDLSLASAVFDGLDELYGWLSLPVDDVLARARDARSKLAPLAVGRDGRLREWMSDDPEVDPHHRHVSHLYELYPGGDRMQPALRDAMRTSLDARGDDSTGWSLAWKIALRARLHDPQAVARLTELVFRDAGVDEDGQRGGLYPNLFAAHPPYQIDGNLGFVAGIVECLIQSHRGQIELLPAYPPQWGAGSVRGLVARPGIAVDVEWTVVDSVVSITAAQLRPLNPEARIAIRVLLNGESRVVDLGNGDVALPL